MPRLLAALALALLWTAQAVAQDDPYRAGPLDSGKMWLFEQPPVAYLAEAYDFRPDEAWFERARLAALRLPNCSASFVSAHGLVATNHHCVRNAIVAVQRDGERLLEEGFFAADLAGERRVDGLYLDQLVAIADVTDRVERALDAAQTEAERAAAREAVFAEIQAERARAAGAGHHAQVVSLYNGGRFSAYTFRRFEDVRLVGAPENDLGFFGGDPDNFTYPRYSLDFALLRVYGADGRPYDASRHYFRWTTEGVEEGDLVFVIGNPGSTDRGDTVAQLEFRRDVTVPLYLEYLAARIATLDAYLTANPEADAVRNQRFGLSNAQKAYLGRRDALQDPIIMARKRDAEAQFRAAVEANPTLRAEFGSLFDEMAEIQAAKRTLRPEAMVFLTVTNPTYSSATLRRALLAARLGTPGRRRPRPPRGHPPGPRPRRPRHRAGVPRRPAGGARPPHPGPRRGDPGGPHAGGHRRRDPRRVRLDLGLRGRCRQRHARGRPGRADGPSAAPPHGGLPERVGRPPRPGAGGRPRSRASAVRGLRDGAAAGRHFLTAVHGRRCPRVHL
jgi:hypothetical protein